MPEDSVFDAIERLHAELDEVHALLTGPEASVRLVLTPESVVLAEARRSYTMLSLFGYRVDGVVVNRIFPDRGRRRVACRLGRGPGRRCWPRSASPSPGCRCGARSTAPANRWASTRCATSRARCTTTPTRSPSRRASGPFTDHAAPTSGPCVHLALPYVTRDEVGLARHGDELVVTVASYRRLLTLPPGLSRHRVAGARVDDGELQVRFKEGAS